MTIKVDAASMRRALLGLVALLFLGHLIGQFSEYVLDRPSLMGLVPRFDLNRERTVPTWIASLLLLSCAACLLLITLAHRRRGSGEALAWAGLALGFLFLAVDETVGFHELLSAPIRERLGIQRDWLYVVWVVPVMVGLALFLLLYLPFLRRLDRRWRRAFVLAGVVYVSGAVGVEVVGAWVRETWGDGLLYAVVSGVEEVLEMVGATLFLTALVRYLSHLVDDVRLDLRPSRG